jgi:hypothetical protein
VLTQVQARTLQDAMSTGAEVPGQLSSRVPVAWTDAAGLPHQGRATVVVGTKKDAAVTIWLDRSGAISAPPRPAGDSAALGGAAGVGTAIVSWLLILGLARLAVVPLNRRRMRDWEREWAQTAPRWRHHQEG